MRELILYTVSTEFWTLVGLVVSVAASLLGRVHRGLYSSVWHENSLQYPSWSMYLFQFLNPKAFLLYALLPGCKQQWLSVTERHSTTVGNGGEGLGGAGKHTL